MTEVLIDGVRYGPMTGNLDEEATRLLCQVYGALWTEAHYDPNNEESRKFALQHVDKMKRLNEILKFKR